MVIEAIIPIYINKRNVQKDQKKLGLSELSTEPYSMLDESTKMNIVRLNKGELVMVHPAFRHPIKIGFPKGAYKEP